jgi:glucosamine kinase
MGTTRTTYLGIDGAGTLCRARIEDESGRVLGEARALPRHGLALTRSGGPFLRLLKRQRRMPDWFTGISQECAPQLAWPALAAAARRRRSIRSRFPFASVTAAPVSASRALSQTFISDSVAACLGSRSGADGAIMVAGPGSE